MIHRMILGELVKVFLLALIALTGLLLLAGIFAEASRNGLSPTQILAIIPFLIPSTLPYTLPTTTLFATCVVYGRLAHDNEILAIKAAGINVLRVVWPGILLGIVISATTIFLYYRPIPRTHFLLRIRFLADVEEFLYSMIKKEGRLVHTKLTYEIYVKRVQGRKLLDAQFMRRAPSGKTYDIIARAKEATLKVDKEHMQIVVQMRSCRLLSGNDDPAYFERKDWPVDLPADLVTPEKTRTNDMTWQEMIERRENIRDTIEKLDSDIAQHTAALDSEHDFRQHIKDTKNHKRQKEQELRDIRAEMNMRPALALGCLCFVLVGCPVGIWFSRSDYLSAFITCFLPIVLIYYPLMLCGINLGRAGGLLPPELAIWFADGLMGLTSIPLYFRLLKH
jgi:lipopolysaccharide export system permease protein